MKFVLVSLVICAFAVMGCGPDPDLVASGKNHTCDLQKFAAQLQADPTNEELKKKIADSTRYLQSVIESANEGDRAATQEAIQKAAAQGCN